MCLFTSHKDVEDHVLTDKHVFESDSMETSMDKARKKWAKYCNDVVGTDRLTCTYELCDVGQNSTGLCG